MADLELPQRGTANVGSAETTTLTLNTDADTAIGDIVVVWASVDYKSANTNLTINTTTGIVNLAGAAGWTTAITSNDGTTLLFRTWVGRVTTAGQKAVVISQTSSGSGLQGIVATYNPNDAGTSTGVTMDPASGSIMQDRSSPLTHASVTPAGTKNRLFCGHGQIQFSGTSDYGAAPANMVQVGKRQHNQYSALQACTQQLTAAGATGTRDQTCTPTALTAGGGGMFALRNQGDLPVTATQEPGRFHLSMTTV